MDNITRDTPVKLKLSAALAIAGAIAFGGWIVGGEYIAIKSELTALRGDMEQIKTSIPTFAQNIEGKLDKILDGINQ